jgi:hypothetical protein
MFFGCSYCQLWLYRYQLRTNLNTREFPATVANCGKLAAQLDAHKVRITPVNACANWGHSVGAATGWPATAT